MPDGSESLQQPHTPNPTSTVKLDLFLPDYPRPLKVERALVRWVKTDSFGVEFTEIQASQRERLRVFLGSQPASKV